MNTVVVLEQARRLASNVMIALESHPTYGKLAAEAHATFGNLTTLIKQGAEGAPEDMPEDTPEDTSEVTAADIRQFAETYGARGTGKPMGHIEAKNQVMLEQNQAKIAELIADSKDIGETPVELALRAMKVVRRQLSRVHEYLDCNEPLPLLDAAIDRIKGETP